MVRVYKVGDNLACILPRGVAEKLKLQGGEEVDFYEIKPGVFTLIKKEVVEGMLREDIGEVRLPSARGELGPEEMELLRKLNCIKFSERIPYNVHKKLGPRERETLSRLVEKGAVRVYKGGKYSKTGVYDISNNVYALLKGGTEGSEGTSDERLERDRYVIIEDTREAERVSKKLEGEIRRCEVVGTRGFDRRFYVAKVDWFSAMSERARHDIRKGGKIEDVARDLGIDEPAARVVLEIMRDKGDVIEKKKGYYELV